MYLSLPVKLSNNHLFQKKEAKVEISEDTSNAIEDKEDQVIALRPLNMEDMRHAKNKVCWT